MGRRTTLVTGGFFVCTLLLFAGCGATGKGSMADPSDKLQQGGVSEDKSSGEERKNVLSSSEQEAAIKQMAQSLLDRLSHKKEPQRIAVLDFCGIDGEPSPCGGLVSQILESELIHLSGTSKNLAFVDRRTADQVMEELKRNATDLMDETQSLQLGKHLGAGLLLVGSVMQAGQDQVKVVARIVGVETTEVFASSVCVLRSPDAICQAAGSPPRVTHAILSEENPKSPFQVEVWTDKAVYHVGDPVLIYAKSNKPGYLVLIDVDANGRTTLLLPNAFHPDPYFLRRGETFVSPAGWFEAAEPLGRGYIKAILSPEPFTSRTLGGTPDDFVSGVRFRSLGSAATRGIAVSAKKANSGFGTWWVNIRK